MNPIEQIWKELRKRGFRNEVFSSLEKVVDRLCDAICSLTPAAIHSITGTEWIIKATPHNHQKEQGRQPRGGNCGKAAEEEGLRVY